MNPAEPHRVTVLTPPGAGAIALLRVVGPDPVALVNTVFHPKSGSPQSVEHPNRLRLGRIVEGDETLDEVVATALTINGFHAVDITPHGGTRVVERILQVLQRCGAEVCQQRDAHVWTWSASCLLEREILEAMTHAKTERALRFLAYQRSRLPQAVETLAESAVLDPVQTEEGLRALISELRSARALTEGVTVALVGPPNSGKSTLFNRLLGREAVVVSDIAGTTRDWIAEPIELLGLPVTLVDTAGRHEAGSPLESLAIEAGRRMAERADLRVLVLDGGAVQADDRHALRSPDFIAWNKADLHPRPAIDSEDITVSARTGAGIDRLAERILAVFGLETKAEPRPALFTEAQFAWANEVLSQIPQAPRRAATMLRERIARNGS